MKIEKCKSGPKEHIKQGAYKIIKLLSVVWCGGGFDVFLGGGNNSLKFLMLKDVYFVVRGVNDMYMFVKKFIL